MSIEKIKELLNELQNELNKSESEIDSETLSQLQEMDIKLQQFVEQQHQDPAELNDLVIKMEHQFKDKHPLAANLIQEAMNILSKAGI